MGLSKEDRILIKNLYELKGYGARRLVKEFPAKEWKRTTLNDFVNDFFDNALAHRAHAMVEFLLRKTPAFIPLAGQQPGPQPLLVA